MSERQLHADILTPAGWCRGHVHWDAAGRIGRIDGTPIDPARAGQEQLPMALPGFIDLHIHGAGGRDVMQGGEAAAVIGQTLAQHGTTAWLATTMTAPQDDITLAFAGLQGSCSEAWASAHAAQTRPPTGLPHLLGVHLEGPYISEKKLCAQPPHAAVLDLACVRRWHAMVPIRVVTLAPEPANLAGMPDLLAMGMRVQLGHSDADYDTAHRALQAGASGFTHLFNAMSGLHHRAPGMVGAALAHAQHAEIIPDLLHVHPGAILSALRSIPGLYCVSDGTSATGMPDGAYALGQQTVHKCQGGVRLADGTLAGSTLTLDVALRNLVQLGLSVAQASARVSTIAADYLGLPQHGRLQAGAWADVVLLDADLTVQGVWVAGARV
jgi:N-acetylglucosamine-6-phosphate deacetylase